MQSRLIFVCTFLALICGSVMPPPAFAEDNRPALSNGFGYGMAPEDVIHTVTMIPGVKSAKVRKNKKDIFVDVDYDNNEGLDRFGFKFMFGFSFIDGKLVWVDLIGRRDCSDQVRPNADKFVDHLSSLYGKPDGNVFRLKDVDVYVLNNDRTPESPHVLMLSEGPSTSSVLRVYDYRRAMDLMERQCPEDHWANVTVRFKGRSPSVVHPITQEQIEVGQRANRAQADKDKNDTDSLALPH